MSIQKVIEDSKKIVININQFQNLKDYRQLTQQANEFGTSLWEHGLTTSQIESFLKRVVNLKKMDTKYFDRKIKPELSNLKTDLEKPAKESQIVKELKNVIDAAINNVKDLRDFDYLIQLVELCASLEQEMARTIVKSGSNLSNYPIRKLVKQADELGSYLKQQGLKTNQIRKFLDTVNRLKIQVKLALQGNFKTSNSRENIEDEESEIIFLKDFPKIDTELVLLKQKLVYAAARQSAVNPFKEVIDIALDKVHDSDDFDRFYQLIESIIAYHKAAGGD